MGRPPKNPIQPEVSAENTIESVKAEVSNLTETVREALQSAISITDHGALAAIDSALTDLKSRAASVEAMLSAEWRHIVETIKSL